jgi:hypothetical protein
MNQRRVVPAILCAIALSMTYPARPAAAQAKLPALVTADLEEMAALCRESGGKPNTANAVESVDLNRDGKTDYVLDVGSIVCEGAASAYGDREKIVRVYAGDGAGGAVNAFSDAVFGVSLEGSKLWLTVSGGGCGKPPADSFATESFCNRSLLWDAKARKFVYAPVSTVRMIE